MEKNRERLYELIEGYDYFATMGTCKNAGKTTVLNYLINHYKSKYVIGITSIGYDGEKKDAITNLEKPRIATYKGMLIATSSQCLEEAEFDYRVVEETGYKSILGTIVIVEALGGGVVEVAGPSIASELNEVAKRLLELGADKVIADGAAGRVSFGVYAQCCILSVGAAKFNDLNKIMDDGEYQIELMNLRQAAEYSMDDLPRNRIYRKVRKSDDNRELIRSEFISDESHLEVGLPVIDYLFRGILSDSDVEKIIKKDKDGGKRIIVKDPSAVFISKKTYHTLLRRNGKLMVINPISLKAVTINPMTPYGAWVDEKIFKEEMGRRILQPVYNVVEDDVSDKGESGTCDNKIGAEGLENRKEGE